METERENGCVSQSAARRDPSSLTSCLSVLDLSSPKCLHTGNAWVYTESLWEIDVGRDMHLLSFHIEYIVSAAAEAVSPKYCFTINYGKKKSQAETRFFLQ